MDDIDTIKKNLEKIYKKIPNFDCKHCHECCGPIVWFKSEEFLIKEYLQKNKLERITWTKKEFENNNMKCPYLKDNRCVIYPVRPIVCRLQGNISELPCKFNKNKYLSIKQIQKIKKNFNAYNNKFDGGLIFYSTRKMTKI